MIRAARYTLLSLALAAVPSLAGCGGSQRVSVPPSGRCQLVLKALPQSGQQLTTRHMQAATDIMVSRIKKLGVASSSVAIRGGNEIVIQLTGVPGPAKAATIIGTTGQLQFFDFEKDLAPPTVNQGAPTPYPTLYALLSQIQGEAKKGTPEAYYLFGRKTKTSAPQAVLQGPDPTQKALLAPYRGKQPPGTSILAVPANREVVSGPVSTQATRPVGHSPNGLYWYLFRLNPSRSNGPPELSANDLKRGAIAADRGIDTGQQEVVLGFTSHGAEEFQAITKAEYQRGRLIATLHGSAGRLNPLYVQHTAIVLDGKLDSAPYIDYTDNTLSLGIAGGAATMSNIGSAKAAKDLALILQSGALPYSFQQTAHLRCAR